MMVYWFLQIFSRIIHNWYFLEIFVFYRIFSAFGLEFQPPNSKAENGRMSNSIPSKTYCQANYFGSKVVPTESN